MHSQWNCPRGWRALIALFFFGASLACGMGTNEGPRLKRVGYYVFVGKGDYKDEFGPKTPYFSLADWRKLIDDLKSQGATTFLPLMTGHRLPYPSRAFPDYVETDARTAKDVDPQLIIDYAKEKRLEVILALTTTGHCNSYAQDHPEHCIVNEDGSPRNALCPNRAGAPGYPRGVLEEVLTRYRNYDGLLIHPPETRPECFCSECRTLYKQKTGADYASASPRDRRRFFIQSYFRFVNELFGLADKLAPLRVKLMFNCNWMDDDLDLFGSLPQDLAIFYWDYNLNEDYLQGRFQDNLRRYTRLGRPIWFMPSTIPRWWTPADAGLEWGCRQVARQVEIAGSHKIENIGFFVGAYVQPGSIELISSAMNQ
jgi:hypothetical protein